LLRSVKYGLYGVVLAGVVGGTVAWMSMDKTVHLVVDGMSQTVHTTAEDVGQVVKDAGYRPGAHDLLAPSASTHVSDGAIIVLRRGRLMRLNVDGTERAVWTTAPTVAGALGALGFAADDFTSVSRSGRLPLGVLDISVRTAKPVTVVHDGQRTSLISTDATVGQLLSDLSVTVGPLDRLSSSPSSTLAAGMTIKLSRVEHKTLKTTRPLSFHLRTSEDPALESGRTRLATLGRRGLLQTTWAAVYVDGRLATRTKIKTVVVRKPVDQVTAIGTKRRPVVHVAQPARTAPPAPPATSSRPKPAPPPASFGSLSSGSPQAIARSMLGNYGWSQSQFSCLDSIWSRESGWRVNASNPSGAYGIPQALPGSKMASAGPNWQTNARTQIAWGLGYIAGRYVDPCGAWSFWQAHNWY